VKHWHIVDILFNKWHDILNLNGINFCDRNVYHAHRCWFINLLTVILFHYLHKKKKIYLLILMSNPFLLIDDFNFPIFFNSNTLSSPAYGVIISQLIRYSRACNSSGFSKSICPVNKETAHSRFDTPLWLSDRRGWWRMYAMILLS